MLNNTVKEIYDLPSLLPQDASFRLRTDWSHVHFVNNIFNFVSGEVCNWQACQDIHIHGNYKSNGISHCKKYYVSFVDNIWSWNVKSKLFHGSLWRIWFTLDRAWYWKTCCIAIRCCSSQFDFDTLRYWLSK